MVAELTVEQMIEQCDLHDEVAMVTQPGGPMHEIPRIRSV